MLTQFNNMQISFQGNILGFEDLDIFQLESINDTPFAYLNSIENPEISFLTTTPFHWYKEYTLKLDQQAKRKLELEREEDVLVLNIVTLKEDLELSTINLLAPLLINIKHQSGIQYVFHEQTLYRTNHPLMKNTNKESQGD
ncbi:flagellar assembly protein FliW [Paenibacillus barengoltzii]|jgi:flagellar assembly factor FliW|uniref:Flagellar assembly factor FliW n=1 Tax=Paenibacillus barengoltzii J12 TaxID=935846 RepID=A0ABY1LTC8_9BACL|nr:flagellar assembly protein FliW [Paenibacillus barengoltzii]SME94857.1 flagellar assembly factor FliW [Paenibacillus barengoltzii J12]